MPILSIMAKLVLSAREVPVGERSPDRGRDLEVGYYRDLDPGDTAADGGDEPLGRVPPVSVAA